MGLTSEIKKINNLSLGLAVLLAQLFLFINVKAFFPQSMVAGMEKLIATYLILYAVMFAIPDLRLKMFNEPFSTIKYYITTFLISALILSLLGNFFIGGRTSDPSLGVITAISTVALSLILVHSIIIAFIEEIFFRDFVAGKVGAFWSSLFFGVFHFAIYNFNLLAVLWASLLGYFFLVLKRRYSPQSNIVNIAVHAAYNVVVLGIVLNVLGGGL